MRIDKYKITYNEGEKIESFLPLFILSIFVGGIMKDTNITFRIEREYKEELNALADKSGKSLSRYIYDLLVRFLKKKKS